MQGVRHLRGFLPQKVLQLDEKEKVVAVRPQDCIWCKLCEMRCPDLAIEVMCN